MEYLLAISNTPFQNIFETIILINLENHYKDPKEQFGFKSDSSCGHAIYVINQLIKLCTKRKQKLIICMLDASKAFDKVDRTRLWAKLFEEGVDHSIIFCLMAYYAESIMLVKNGDEISVMFLAIISVRQGGVASPKLYSVYGKKMVDAIKSLGIGVNILFLIISIILYADDLTLVANSDNEMQQMINKVHAIADEDDVKFNAKKSIIMIFNQEVNIESIFKLGDIIIQRVKETRYLGYQISESSNNLAHVKIRIQKAYTAANMLRTLGLTTCNLDVSTRGFMYKVFIRPLLYYGLDNIVLNNTEIDLIKRTEGNIVKSLIGINKQVHTTSLFSALGLEQTTDRLNKEKLLLFERLNKIQFTAEIMQELAFANDFNSFNNDVCKILNMEHSEDINSILKKTNDEIVNIECKSKDMQRYDGKITTLKEIFKIKNRSQFIKQMHDCIGFVKKKPQLNAQITDQIQINI